MLSHLGSGAEIFSLVIEAGVTGAEPPTMEEFQPIWDTWNARTPEEQAAQSMAANEALVVAGRVAEPGRARVVQQWSCSAG